MTRFLFILLSFLFLSFSQDKYIYPYKYGKPTTAGIKQYVYDNEENFIAEYSAFVHDTIYDASFNTDKLSEYYNSDSNELGCFFYPNSITITNEEMFLDYELSRVNKYNRKSLIESNRFVKGTVMHEMTHVYFYQIIREMQYEKMKVNALYRNNINIFPNNTYGAEFIEEGVCEYVAELMDEIVPCKYIYKPKNLNEIIINRNQYEIKYRYSRIYVKGFLSQYSDSLKTGIKILLRNEPPTTEEMLTPEIYYQKLK